jgi:hypothetical protein
MIIHRIGQPPFEIRRGDRVRYRGENVTVRGISEARKMVRIQRDGAVRDGGIWVPCWYIYPPLPEEKKLAGAQLSRVVRKANREPPGGWGEADRIGGR